MDIPPTAQVPLGSRVPWRSPRIIASALLAVLLLFFVVRWYQHSQPEYVLTVIDHIHTRADVDRESAYFTPQGKAILLWLMSKQGDQPSQGRKTIFSDPAVNGSVCDIRAEAGDVAYTIRLIHTGRWQFNDLYLDKAEGKNIGIWASYMKDHPYATWLGLNWSDLLGAFLQGFLIGLTGGG